MLRGDKDYPFQAGLVLLPGNGHRKTLTMSKSSRSFGSVRILSRKNPFTLVVTFDQYSTDNSLFLDTSGRCFIGFCDLEEDSPRSTPREVSLASSFEWWRNAHRREEGCSSGDAWHLWFNLITEALQKAE